MGKIFGSLVKKVKDEKANEFEHSREYVPIKPLQGVQTDQLLDVLAASIHKTAEIHCNSISRPPPTLITTDERKQLLADRKEAERLEKERIEREAASEELRMVAPTPAPTSCQAYTPLLPAKHRPNTTQHSTQSPSSFPPRPPKHILRVSYSTGTAPCAGNGLSRRDAHR